MAASPKAPGGLAEGVETGPARRASSSAWLGGLLSTCANPACSSGWLHLLRSRSAPVFEGGWSCSPACTLARLEAAVRRELEGRRGESGNPYRHRIPLGLVMLEQGWISPAQLRGGLDAQKHAGDGRLGDWLTRHCGVSEQLVTRALSLQWNCPVLATDGFDPGAMALLLPRLFVEAYGALPLRLAAGKILYLGFEERLDPVAALALERMLGLRVEPGLIPASQFAAAHQHLIAARFPRAELIESASEAPLARVLARAIERKRPIESRLVRVHDCLWLRMWTRAQTGGLPDIASVEDVICSLVLA